MLKSNPKTTEKSPPPFRPKVPKLVQSKTTTYLLKNGTKLTLKNESFNNLQNQLKLF
jgi:hypothetical protein